MKEHVSELTPEEFQKTFPITLADVIPEYAAWYEEEKAAISGVLNGQDIVRISHIGSTAVPGIKAKPMVDILLELDGTCRTGEAVEALKTIGFGTEVCIKKEDPFEVLLAKGMTVAGFEKRVFLLHMRYAGDWNELYFRDYLLEFPDVASAYGSLKERILEDIRLGRLERLPNGRPSGYSNAKRAFVDEISRQAKARYQGRYRIG